MFLMKGRPLRSEQVLEKKDVSFPLFGNEIRLSRISEKERLIFPARPIPCLSFDESRLWIFKSCWKIASKGNIFGNFGFLQFICLMWNLKLVTMCGWEENIHRLTRSINNVIWGYCIRAYFSNCFANCLTLKYRNFEQVFVFWCGSELSPKSYS